MVFSAPSIETDEEGRTGVTLRYRDDATNTGARSNNLTEISALSRRSECNTPLILTARSAEPETKIQKRKDSTHVPFYKSLPKFKRRSR